MPADAPCWDRPPRPLQEGRRDTLFNLLLLVILLLLLRQVVLDCAFAVDQYRQQMRTDSALAGAPARMVRVKVIYSPPDPQGASGSTLVQGLPTHCPGVGRYFNSPNLLTSDWCLYALVDLGTLRRGMADCTDSAGSPCSEGLVPVREGGGRVSLGDRTGATSFLRLAGAIFMSELALLLMVVPTTLTLALAVPGLMLNLVYGRLET